MKRRGHQRGAARRRAHQRGAARRQAHQRGAALLLAMMVVALVVTAAAGMAWLQTRAVQLEAAERARSQAGWILSGALDWARLILQEDQRTALRSGRAYDALDEPWATPLAEARLSSFLAADQENNADSGPEAFISGAIVDAQSRFNLRGLVDGAGKPQPLQVAALQRLADLVGAPSDTAARIAAALQSAYAPAPDEAAPLKPSRWDDLVWLGIDAATLARLAPFADWLPLPTPVNANTASREALVAAIDKLDLGTAERLVQQRRRKPFQDMGEVQALLPQGVQADAQRVSVGTSWFWVDGRLRLDERVLEEHSLLQREPNQITVRRRDRRSFVAG